MKMALALNARIQQARMLCVISLVLLICICMWMGMVFGTAAQWRVLDGIEGIAFGGHFA
jgi:hypothetical protein